jgi:hypothetical protein
VSSKRCQDPPWASYSRFRRALTIVPLRSVDQLAGRRPPPKAHTTSTKGPAFRQDPLSYNPTTSELPINTPQNYGVMMSDVGSVINASNVPLEPIARMLTVPATAPCGGVKVVV